MASLSARFGFKLAFLLLAVTSYGQPQPECENFEQADKSDCAILYGAFQTALVDTDTNLFNLRKRFYPSSTAEPILLNVEYLLSFEFAFEDENCPESCTIVNTAGSLNATSSDVNLSTMSCNYGWTSSVFYTILHPVHINRMQPQLAFITMRNLELIRHEEVNTAINWDGKGAFETIQLYLLIPHFNFTPTCDQVDHTLRDMTSQLKVYATEQDILTEWETKEAGYTLVGSVLGRRWWEHANDYGSSTLVILSYIFSLLLWILLCCAIPLWLAQRYEKWISKIVDNEKISKEEKSRLYNVHRSIVWSFTGVLAQCCIAVIITEFVQIGRWFEESNHGILGPIKITWLLSNFFISFVLPLIIICVIDKAGSKIMKENYIFKSVHGLFTGVFFVFNLGACISLCHMCIPKDRMSNFRKTKCYTKIIKGRPYLVPYILIFIWVTTLSIFVFNIAPVIVLLLIFPFRVLTFYSSIAAAFFLITFTLMHGETRRSSSQTLEASSNASAQNGEQSNQLQVQRQTRKVCSKAIRIIFTMFTPLISGFFVLISGVVFVYVYGALVSGGFASPLLVALISLIPSAMMSTPTVWLYKKKIGPALKLKEDLPKPPNSVGASAESTINTEQGTVSPPSSSGNTGHGSTCTVPVKRHDDEQEGSPHEETKC